MKLEAHQLMEAMPRVTAERAAYFLPFLQEAMDEFEINTPARIAAFLAQLAHESAELRFWEELTSGEAYENRRDLGNNKPGDGPRYKGRGPIQLTGRYNYRDAGKALKLPLEDDPDMAKRHNVGFRVAGWFWKDHGLNELADRGEFQRITFRINGGYNGKAHRDAYYERARRALGYYGQG